MKKILSLVCLLFALAPASAFAQAATVTASTLTATADLGTETFSGTITTSAASAPENVNIQVFPLNTTTGAYPTVNPGINYTIALYPGQANPFTFTVTGMPVGTYTTGKMVLFAAGSNYQDPNAISLGFPSLNMAVGTTQVRVTAPSITTNGAGITVVPATSTAGAYASVPFTIIYPVGFTNTYSAFWLQAKGSDSNFVQDWYAMAGGQNNGVTYPAGVYTPYQTTPAGAAQTAQNGYMSLTGTIEYPLTNPGLINIQYGLYDYNWNLYAWVYPGDNVSFGNWVTPLTPGTLTTIAAATAPASSAVPFWIGGNYGNQIATLDSYADASVGYFALLKANGLKVIRFNYDATKFATTASYKDQVFDLTNQILNAGCAAVVTPQDLPAGDTLDDQVTTLTDDDTAVATQYAGNPLVMIDVLNEPHAYSTWAAWSPVADSIAKAVKAVSPSTKVIVESENYAADMTAASANPLPAADVDYYGWHPYLAPSALASKCGSGNLPLICEEYYDGADGGAFDVALQSINGLKGVMAWAWTEPGDDSLPLVQSQTGASIAFTATGQQEIADYAAWDAGKLIAAPVATPPAPTTTSTDAEIAALQTQVATLTTQLAASQANVAALTTQVAALTTQSTASQTQLSALQTAEAHDAQGIEYERGLIAQLLAGINALNAKDGLPPLKLH